MLKDPNPSGRFVPSRPRRRGVIIGGVLLAVVTLAGCVPGQHKWADTFGGTAWFDVVQPKDVAVDGDSVFTVGAWAGRVNFGDGDRTSAGVNDGFVTRRDPDGTFRWTRTFGSGTQDAGVGVAIGTSGNAIVTGQFMGTVDFGDPGNPAPLTSAGSYDVFVAAYTKDNAHLWSRRFGGVNGDTPAAVVVDGAGNVIVVGAFQGTIDTGGGPLTSAGGNDVFVAAYAGATGAHLWSKRFGGTSADLVQGAAAQGNRVVITGHFKGNASFGGANLVSAGETEAFVAQYDTANNGAHVWSKRFGHSSYDRGEVTAFGTGGNVVVAGTFSTTIDLGGGSLTNSGAPDFYLGMLTPDGGHVWSKQFGSATTWGQTVVGGVTTDAAGVFLTGTVLDDIDFGGGILPHLSPGFGYDPTLAKFALGNGDHLWSRRFPSTTSDYAQGVAADANGPVITGYFSGTIDFGGGPLREASESANGSYDGFVARFAP